MNEALTNWGIKKITYLGIAVILFILTITMSGKIWEEVDAGEIVVIQGILDGNLHVYADPGPVLQNFGKVTHYKKSFTYSFDMDSNSSGDTIYDGTIKIRFNDGGHAQIDGSVRIDLPVDENSIKQIHSIFGSQPAIENQLIRPIMSKSIYMTGPLLSSKESSAEKRNYLLSYIEDQASEGVYKTRIKESRKYDSITREERVIQQVEVIEDAGVVKRQEISLFKKFHINISNLSINNIIYDKNVEAQIVQQQQATMQVQTAMANAKKAEQDAITAEMQGKANAAKAKWEQEVLKAQAVTKAEQEKAVAITNAEKEKEVAKLNSAQAEFYKKQQILEGEGEAAKKRLLMASNNMLEYRIDAWKEVNTAYAKALENSNWVPTTLITSGSGVAGTMHSDAGQSLIQAVMALTAKQLAVSPSPAK